VPVVGRAPSRLGVQTAPSRSWPQRQRRRQLSPASRPRSKAASRGFHDKAWLAPPGDGVVHIMWERGVPGNIYMRSTTRRHVPREPDEDPPAWAARDVTGGGMVPAEAASSMSAPARRSRPASQNGGAIQFRAQLDARRHTGARQAGQPVVTRSMPGLSDRDRRVRLRRFLATDRFADSPLSGAIYYVCKTGAGATPPTSLHGGASTRARLDAPPSSQRRLPRQGCPEPNNWQVFPRSASQPLGVIDVSWMGHAPGRHIDAQGANMGQTAGHNVGDVYPKLGPEVLHLQPRRRQEPGARTSTSATSTTRAGTPSCAHHQDGKIFLRRYNASRRRLGRRDTRCA